MPPIFKYVGDLVSGQPTELREAFSELDKTLSPERFIETNVTYQTQAVVSHFAPQNTLGPDSCQGQLNKNLSRKQ